MEKLTYLQQRLFDMRDMKYRDFQYGLMPSADPDTVIGVRMPELRKLARELAGTERGRELLAGLPHRYYEENNLHALLIEEIKDYDAAEAETDRFLPYVDNWATCDLMSPKVFREHRGRLLNKIKEWTASGRTYTVRFGLEMLMKFYLDECFEPGYLELAAGVRSEEYYINMMTAWFFATALAKQYESAVRYMEMRQLDYRTHNKAIQKALESRRVSDEHKAYLRTLKIRRQVRGS